MYLTSARISIRLKNKRISYDLFQLKQKMEIKMAKKSSKGKKKKANKKRKR